MDYVGRLDLDTWWGLKLKENLTAGQYVKHFKRLARGGKGYQETGTKTMIIKERERELYNSTYIVVSD